MMDVVDFASHVYKLLRRRENEIKDFLAGRRSSQLGRIQETGWGASGAFLRIQ
jgi:hypothetical protein